MSIDSAENIKKELEKVNNKVYLAHSQIKDKKIENNIKKFEKTEHGALIAPKLLDEGVDIPDAEIGINVSGAKTKLQLVQRMGRILRKKQNKQPTFHHFIAVPQENYIENLDSKQFVKELYWIRELGEQIKKPEITKEKPKNKPEIRKAEQQGEKIIANKLLNNETIKTTTGQINLEEIVDALNTAKNNQTSAPKILLNTINQQNNKNKEKTWKNAINKIKNQLQPGTNITKKIWWLKTLYKEKPKTLKNILKQQTKK